MLLTTFLIFILFQECVVDNNKLFHIKYSIYGGAVLFMRTKLEACGSH